MKRVKSNYKRAGRHDHNNHKEKIDFGRAIFLGIVGSALVLLPFAAGMPIFAVSVVVVPAAVMFI